jgi:hypothetical protein
VKTLALPIVALVLLSGCATVNHTPLSKDAAVQLQGKTIVRTRYATPDFSSFTAGKAAFGLIGVAAMISEGNSIIKENEIADPAIEIGRALSDKSSSVRATKVIESPVVTPSDDVEALVAAYKGADYLLDVKTFNWMFAYYPADWAHYKVLYSARFRLIDAARKTVVAESLCRSTEGDDAKPPSKDQLLDDKARLLKAYLAKATVTCTDVLAKEILQF